MVGFKLMKWPPASHSINLIEHWTPSLKKKHKNGKQLLGKEDLWDVQNANNVKIVTVETKSMDAS